MDTDRTYKVLSDLRGQMAQLRVMLVPGTPRRWNQREMTAGQREAQNAQALKDRAAKFANSRLGLYGTGESKAPLNVTALDALRHIDDTLRRVEAEVCRSLGITPLAGATTKVRIERLVSLLDRIATIDGLADWVEDELYRLRRFAQRVTGDTNQAHFLDARCHICDSRSLLAIPEKEIVLCTNDDCRCADEGCHCYSKRRHCWRWTFEGDTAVDSWSWLSKVLDGTIDDAEETAA